MYGIIHKKIFDSTIIAEGHEVAYVFMSMIALSDEEDICDMSLPALALRINMPLEKVEHSVNRLGLPDEDSKSQTFEGRRVVPLREIDEIESNRGWFMVNRESYISEAKKENRKKTNARHYMRTKSENVLIKTENVLKTPDSDHVKTHIDIDVDIDIKKISRFPDFWKNYPRKEGSKKKAETSFNNLTKKKQELAITDCLTRYLDTDKKYTPYPTTYINGELWEAETEQEEKTWR